MNEKEIAEIRRRLKPDKSNITHVRGCYVNEKGEIVSSFNQSIAMLPEEDAERLLGVLRRSLSGGYRKNLIDITFSTQQVVDSEEHRLLMALRNSTLTDEEAVQAFFQKVISTVTLEGNYLILIAHDKYDVPYRSSDGEKQADASSELFSYLLCGICPIKETKPGLGYYVFDNAFRTSQIDWLVGAPEIGFLFPAFDDRCANIYAALYYSRDAAESHQPFVDAVFHTALPMPAEEQKETFGAILEDTLSEECSYEVVQAVHGQLCEMMETHKVNKEVEPLLITKDTVKHVLQNCGVAEEHVTAFDEKYDDAFGTDAELSPGNVVDSKQFEVKTPNVTVKVKPEYSNLVETRVIDGTSYLLIRVEEGVEVNGVNVQLTRQEVVTV